MKNCPNPKCKEANEDEALFCHLCGEKLQSSGTSYDIDSKILDIISQNSFSKRPMAAYEARKYANQICRKHFGKTKKNYREYVEMLIVKNYPKELEKSNLGKRYISWLYTSIIMTICGIGFVVSPFIIWKILVPTYKQLTTLCK